MGTAANCSRPRVSTSLRPPMRVTYAALPTSRRLVYKIAGDEIRIAACRYRYER
jgi:hypothetical protein